MTKIILCRKISAKCWCFNPIFFCILQTAKNEFFGFEKTRFFGFGKTVLALRISFQVDVCYSMVNITEVNKNNIIENFRVHNAVSNSNDCSTDGEFILQ